MKKAKFLFIQTHKDKWPVKAMCKALKVTRQGYYQWLKRPVSKHALRDFELAKYIEIEYLASHCIYGAPKIYMSLKRRGIITSQKRVARLMQEGGLKGVTRSCAKRSSAEKRVSKKYSSEDLVRRNFKADRPNQAWFADITYVKTYQGWLYLAVVMDVYSRMVVGWAMGPNINAELVNDALRMAIARRNPPEGCIHHSDHGSQYVSLLLGKTMKKKGIRPSMGSISSPWDNAVTESLMGVIKSECVNARTFESREEAALEIFEYIEVFYNKLRIHSALGWLSPAEFEEQHAQKDHSAAA